MTPWLCTVCSFLAKPEYSEFEKGVWTTTYCSLECRNSVRGKRIYFLPALLLISGYYFLYLIFLASILIIIYEMWIGYNRKLVRIRDNVRNDYSTVINPSSNSKQTSHQKIMSRVRRWKDRRGKHYWVNNHERFVPVEGNKEKGNVRKLIYSEILDEMVGPCCYQTARLSETYCMCGRALRYHPFVAISN
jgi:hypothetical protein